MHVAEVVLAAVIIAVVNHQLVFVRKLEEDGEEAEKFDYDFFVAFLMTASISD